MLLGIIGWIVIGLIIGFVVSKTLDLHGDDPRLGIAAAAAGAVVVATGYTLVSGAGVSAWNVWSMLFAAIGAGVAVAVWHGVRSRYVSHASYTRRRSY
jgi:uncharacterized membrane protein YeaQ/YmgE (transglycosylase-associated protein family)